MTVKALSAAALFIAALGAAAATPAAAQPAHPWPTKEFEVRTTPPQDDALDAEVAAAVAAGALPPPPVQDLPLLARRKMELHLKRVATYLESEGFRPPKLKIYDSDRTPATEGGVYVVYVYDYDDTNAGSYHNACNDWWDDLWSESFMRIDAAKPSQIVNQSAPVKIDFATGEIDDDVYPTLSHELFHAVQAAYPFRESVGCANGKWITEGTARAIEMHTEEVVRGKDLLLGASGPFRQPWREKLQPRRYDNALYIGTNPGVQKLEAYATASFWMYLAEMDAAGTTKVPTLYDGERDYSYLQDFFETPVEKPPGHAAELLWLKTAMRRHFNRSVPGVYSEFVTMASRYAPTRVRGAVGQHTLREAMFGDCAQAIFETGATSAEVTFEFAPVSARCVEISSPAQAPVELFVVGRNRGPNDDLTAYNGVFVGVPGGHLVDRPDVAIPARHGQDAETGELVGVWRVPFDPRKDQALIISSIADISPDNPKNGPIEFTITHPDWDTSLTEIPPAPPPAPDPSPPASDGQEIPAADPALGPAGAARTLNAEREAAAARADANLKTFSSTVKSSTHVGRRPDWGTCDEPFKFMVCGPYSTISLELAPGSLFDLGATSGRGGVFAQFSGNLLATFAATGGGMAGMVEWVEQQEAIPGYRISMTFPMIDYGFTGTFENAFIDVSMPDDKRWVTYGPQDAIPGPGKMFAFSGRVTIDEFSPDVLRGSFGGPLVDPEDAIDFEDPVLPVKHNLSGRFTIAAPFTDDDRTVMINPIEYADVMDDFEIVMPGMTAAAEDPLARARAEAANNPGRRYSPSASAVELCDCSCNFVETASPVCKDYCAPTHLACEGRAFTPAPLPTPKSAAEVAAEIADLRKAYYDFMVENKGRAYADNYIQAFDNVPDTIENKRMMLDGDFVKWERIQNGDVPQIEPSDLSPEEEAAAIAALRVEFIDFLTENKTAWFAKNMSEVYDLIPGGVAEKRKWIAEVAPEFAEGLAE